MKPTTLRFAPGVEGLESLGDATAESWMTASPEDLDPRAALLGDAAGVVHVRLPLPGTVTEEGRRLEAPRGAGTGWLHLYRFTGGGARGLAARFTSPRSTSLAARHWNMICHLRAHGLGAPELVALGEQPGTTGVVRSFLITRELEGFTPVPSLLAREAQGRRRGLVLRSIGLSLRALFRCGAWLPQLRLEDLLVQDSGARSPDACGALELEELQRDERTTKSLGLKRTRLPAVAFTNFRRARLVGHVRAARRERLLDSLDRELPVSVTRRERLSVLALARRSG